MIKTHVAYQAALERLERDEDLIRSEESRFRELGLSDEEVSKALEPHRSFHQQLREEVEWYEAAKRAEPRTLNSLNHLGRTLIAMRIAAGLTQNDLAKLLDVSPSVVSRDEADEYHNISVERAQTIMELLKVRVEIRLEPARPELVAV